MGVLRTLLETGAVSPLWAAAVLLLVVLVIVLALLAVLHPDAARRADALRVLRTVLAVVRRRR